MVTFPNLVISTIAYRFVEQISNPIKSQFEKKTKNHSRRFALQRATQHPEAKLGKLGSKNKKTRLNPPRTRAG